MLARRIPNEGYGNVKKIEDMANHRTAVEALLLVFRSFSFCEFPGPSQ